MEDKYKDKSARQSMALGYAIAKAEDTPSTFISPMGFCDYYGECPDHVSLNQAWKRILADKELLNYVNDWVGRQSKDT